MSIQKSHFQNTPERMLPDDDRLPGLADMLNADKVRLILKEKLTDVAGAITGCQISYIRYKPLTNCIVAYSLTYKSEHSDVAREILCYAKIHTDSDFKNAAEKAKSHRWMEIDPLPATLILTEFNAVIYFFPNDSIIDGLRLLSDPKKIQRILYEHYDKYPEKEWRISDRRLKFTPVRYKPERRAVLRCRTKTVNRQTGKKSPLEFYLRIYADERGADVYEIQRALYESSRAGKNLGIPKPITYLSDRRALLMESVHGKTLIDCIDDKDGSYVAETARALAALHALKQINLPAKRPGEFRGEIMDAAEMIKTIFPEEMELVNHLTEVLIDNIKMTTQHGPVHGDFHYGQILNDKKTISIIDFDRAYLGDGLADVGNFIAHMKFLRLSGRIDDDSVLAETFLSEYAKMSGRDFRSKEIDSWTAYHLFMLAVGPFRSLEHNWKRQIGNILKECSKILNIH